MPILSTRKATITMKDDKHMEAAVEVSNFGPGASEAARLTFEVLDSDDRLVLQASAPCPALQPYGKTTLTVVLDAGKLKTLENYTLRSSVAYRNEEPLVYEEQRVLLDKPSVRGDAAFELTSGQHPGENEGADKLTDGNDRSKLCIQTEGDSVELMIKLEKPTVATCIYMASANDVPERDPYHWSIEGSRDGHYWKKIKEFTFEQPINKRHKRVSVEFRNTTPYRYYRLVFRDTHGDPHFQLAELDLY